MTFYSHLEEKILLKDHLYEVGKRAKEYFFFDTNNNLKNIAYYVGLTHDIGKYSTYFQDRLFKRKNWGKLANHAFLSSLYSFFVVNNNLEQSNLREELKEFLPLISLYAVFHHHTDLTSLNNIENHVIDETHKNILIEQLKDLQKNSNIINEELSELDLPQIEEFINNIDSIIDSIRHLKYKFENKLDDKKREEFSILLLALFSALIDADKKAAGRIQDIDRKDIPWDIVDNYKKRSFSNNETIPINLLREEIYNIVNKKVDLIDLNTNRLFTFTAPTGSGKTLTGFSFAVKLRNKIKETWGYSPRIIYSLPFISIVDQNYKVLEEVLSQIEDFTGNKSAYIIAHHHLSNIEYEEGDELKEIETASSLIESWDSEVIVTTFVQLLHTIIGFKNSFLKKYHNIARSIIILDEVQNIPIDYWTLVKNVFELLSKYLGCYILLMTATRTLIFSQEECIELLDNKEKYFKGLSRTILRPLVKNTRTLEELVPWFIKHYEGNKSYLIVLNTINSSVELYKALRKYEIPNLNYLSANLIPLDKLNVIEKIKKDLNSNKNPVLVSTQVVEAGVDLDFDTVIRDLGPLDSIVQVSGRCNRNFRRGEEKGEVYIFSLKDTNERNYANQVYLEMLPSISGEILREIENKNGTLKESEFLELVERYFLKVKEVKSSEKSKAIYDSLLCLRFWDKDFKSVSDFKLIEEKGIIYSVFIEKDDNAKKIWSKYMEITNDSTLKNWEKRRKFLNIKKDFENYIVNIRVTKNIDKIFNLIFEKDLGYVSFKDVPKFYDSETGFKKGIDGVSALFI
ncbi:MAG: CRISPR-associated helicase Cas3' [Dictyoglomaceae bacterium]|nr:CRISPR-associated helicase Cas3' [Dictyoglomaceae bacterium]HPU44082.1 CRISPR-associated helicase Cas3' [Dictyoglomaceae bacterium]